MCTFVFFGFLVFGLSGNVSVLLYFDIWSSRFGLMTPTLKRTIDIVRQTTFCLKKFSVQLLLVFLVNITCYCLVICSNKVLFSSLHLLFCYFFEQNDDVIWKRKISRNRLHWTGKLEKAKNLVTGDYYPQPLLKPIQSMNIQLDLWMTYSIIKKGKTPTK